MLATVTGQSTRYVTLIKFLTVKISYVNIFKDYQCLGNLWQVTHLCLCHQAAQVGTGDVL